MATTLKTKLLLQLDATYKNVLDLGSPTDSFQKRQLIELSNGTGANAADLMFHDRRTIAASGTEDLDLAGVLASPFGATLTFAEVRAVLITAASCWCCPADGKVAVTAGTGDLLTVANSSSGSSVTYDVVIIGTSA
jgi:hypothetical protein